LIVCIFKQARLATMRSLHSLWLKCHRWAALFLGWILILSGVTGSLLVAARPIDRWLHPEFFVAGPSTVQTPASWESLRERLTREFGAKASFTFRPPREASETLQILVRGAWRGTLYLHPATGAEQGRRGDSEGFLSVLYSLHSALLMQQTGKAVLACAALIYLALCMSGIVLWWPRKWPPSFRMVMNKGLLRALFDVHRTGGAIVALVVLISIATGAYMAWRPIGGWITWISGAPVTAMPVLPPGNGPLLSLDALAQRARDAFPEGTIGYFLYNPRTDRPLAVRMRVPDDPHPNGRSTVWLDPRDGAVLAKHRWNELDPGARINSVVYPLHTGELGGAPGEIGVALSGLALGVLGTSGIWLWWRRRSIRQRSNSI
jgi:uncharacterized iron-regulated membrane protein